MSHRNRSRHSGAGGSLMGFHHYVGKSRVTKALAKRRSRQQAKADMVINVTNGVTSVLIRGDTDYEAEAREWWDSLTPAEQAETEWERVETDKWLAWADHHRAEREA